MLLQDTIGEHILEVDKAARERRESWKCDLRLFLCLKYEVVRGWINYFKIGSILTVSRKLDTVIRYRFRMCIWKHWKNPKTRYKNLVKLGISKKNARCAAEFHGYARVCRTKTVCYAMSNARLKKFGLLSAEEYLCKARCQVNWTAGCGTACPVVWEVGGESCLLLDLTILCWRCSRSI